MNTKLLFVLSGAVVLSSFLFSASARAEQYLGAEGVLRQVETRNATASKAESTNAQDILKADLTRFRENATNLSPADAAKEWLALVNRMVGLPADQMSFGGGTQLSAVDLFAALPPPAVWKELTAAINARPAAKAGREPVEIGLRLVAATLSGDVSARNQQIVGLQEKAAKSGPQLRSYYQNILRELSRTVLETSDDPDAVLLSLEQELSRAQSSRMMGQEIQVPNLVAEVGPEKAEVFLRKALVQPGVTLGFRSANETSRLAQKLTLELMDQLQMPQWGLVNSLDAVTLYEAMDRRFAGKTNKPTTLPGLPGLPGVDLPPDMPDPTMNAKATAQVYYMLGLISKNRANDAMAFARKMDANLSEAWASEAFNKAMEHAGYTAAMDDFLYQLLSQDPTMPYWDQYVDLAAKSGTTDRMLTLARSAAARPDLTDNKKIAIQFVLYKALLAADADDEAVEQIKRILATDLPAARGMRVYESKAQLGLNLAQIGFLLNKPDWTQAGIDAVKKWISAAPSDPMFAYEAGSVVGSMENLLFKLNRGSEAEAMLTEALAGFAAPKKNQQEYFFGGASPATGALTALATLYNRAGRPADVLTLLTQSPDWGASDLSQLYGETSLDAEFEVMHLHAGSSPAPMPYFAAEALLAAGRKGEAEKIIDDLLERRPGLDRGYELLLALKGNDAIPKLDELFSRDQFEERPLIWKAHLLQQQNKPDEAEKVVRQAISIDPSDGEEGKGDRMRAYAVLADILEAKGNKKDADFYREVVKAIRLSENADDYYRAGLLKRAIPMYEEGLNHFADAYCIQSRLAIQLSELGKTQEAEEHYRRAYELMPDSFGRVESHCFGCERAFDGERAQGIAEKVFTKLVGERPDKPQVHYLLGYLRQEEERYSEASSNYLAAARLDRDYLNAWVKEQEVSEHVHMPGAQRDEIVFNIVRLDPFHRHSHPDFRRVTDLASLWNALTAASARRPELSTNLLTLTASKAALEKKKANGLPGMEEGMRMYNEFDGEEGADGMLPGKAIAATPFLSVAGQLFQANSMMGLDE